MPAINTIARGHRAHRSTMIPPSGFGDLFILDSLIRIGSSTLVIVCTFALPNHPVDQLFTI
jgi:hypothetical protein